MGVRVWSSKTKTQLPTSSCGACVKKASPVERAADGLGKVGTTCKAAGGDVMLRLVAAWNRRLVTVEAVPQRRSSTPVLFLPRKTRFQIE